MSDEPASSPAERKVVRTYKRVYNSMMELVKAIQDVEPSGVLVEDMTIQEQKSGGIRLAYAATPIQLTIATEERTFTLKVIENKNQNDLTVTITK